MTSGAVGPSSAGSGFPDVAEAGREARELVAKIASQSRFAGSASEARARDFCSMRLEAQGFSVDNEEFVFSEFPGRYGAPLLALILAGVVLLTWHFHSSHGGAGPALVVLALGLAVTGAIAAWLKRRGTSRFPWLRSSSTNLVAVRGRPSVWLVAHIDSKSQTIPMLVRIAAVAITGIAVVALAASLILDWMTAIPVAPGASVGSLVSILAGAVVAGCLPLAVCFTGNKSSGAVDNGSGLAAVLLAAGNLRSHPDVGVMVTSGEELALAGARAYVESHHDRGIAVNCDTIDDRGRFLCMKHRRGRGSAGAAAGAAAAVARSAKRLGLPLAVRGIIPGILADSIAFNDAGWDSVTVSRGNIATLARVHTSGDTSGRLDGTGIAEAARLLAATVEELS